MGETPPDGVRLVRVKNTLHLEELEISEALLPEAKKAWLTVVRGPQPLDFNEAGRLRAW